MVAVRHFQYGMTLVKESLNLLGRYRKPTIFEYQEPVPYWSGTRKPTLFKYQELIVLQAMVTPLNKLYVHLLE